MFGSPHSSPFLQPNNHRPPSRSPSFLSLLRRHEQQQQYNSSQMSTPDPLDTQLAGMGLHTTTAGSSAGQRPTGLIRHRHRPHIHEKAHRAKVKNDREKMRAALLLRAYENKKRNGYQSSMADFEGFVTYFDKVKLAVPHDPAKGSPQLASDEGLKRALNIARASMQE
ncbi:hypothetical protein P691DRAFT_660701 [Macrolepiota fuliginosa MF-IS2]|uniref:Uncharacterized protein n=1 Tax=Macrolepiota fuliginosa MF-IS2 TaxID=1400762 RepID=A0A9P6C829_9AGAR|nr:hypothetical protein P691DRAFT_660701 [Macrolepiota fuliginosa MF-IS2]